MNLPQNYYHAGIMANKFNEWPDTADETAMIHPYGGQMVWDIKYAWKDCLKESETDSLSWPIMTLDFST